MAVAYPDVEWMIVLCDRSGVALSRLTRVASDKEFRFRLNRPASCTFTVPSNDPRVSLVHTDGYPYLHTNNRVIKGYRKESGSWVIRFAGVVLHLEDSGEADKMKTTVTAMDPMALLANRVINKNSTPTQPSPGERYVVTAAGNTLAKDQIDWTNTYSPTGIRTSLGTHTFQTTASQPVAWDRGKSIGEALVELTDTETMDIYLLPVDSTTGILADLSVYGSTTAPAGMGSDKTGAVFGFAAANHSVLSVRRVLDGTQLVNDVTYDSGEGGNVAGTAYTDATSQTAYGKWQSVIANTGTTKTFANTLASRELDFRKQPRTLLSLTPAPERAPQPWTNYWLGDTIQVYVASALRQAVSGKQRVYGVTVSVDDNGFERVGELVCSNDGGY